MGEVEISAVRRRSFIDGTIPHAVLITGEARQESLQTARQLCALFLTGRDDYKTAEETGLLIKVTAEDVALAAKQSGGAVFLRDLLTRVNSTPMQRGRHCFLCADVDLMGEICQNALLKTIEEPPEDTLILLTGKESGCLTTVLSRCMVWRIGAEDVRTVERELISEGIDERIAHRAALLSRGVRGVARAYSTEEFASFFTGAAELLRDSVSPVSPYAKAAELLSSKPKSKGEEDAETSDEPQTKKRTRVDTDKLRELLTIWQAILRDALAMSLGSMDYVAPDLASLRNSLASGFTIGQIQSMMNVVTETETALYYKASGGPALDKLICRIGMCAQRREKDIG